MTLFQHNPVDPSEIREAARLTRIAAGTWFGGWVVAYLLAALFMGGGRGEMALLGGTFALVVVLVVGTLSSIISVRLALRALRLDSSGGLAKVTIGLNIASLLYALGVGRLLLADFLR